MEFILILLLAGVVSGLLLLPLFRRRGSGEQASENPLNDLRAQRDRLYEALRDLEFDYLAGKMEQKEYEALRVPFEREAIQTLHRLDEARPNFGPPDQTENDDALEQEIERYKHALNAGSALS